MTDKETKEFLELLKSYEIKFRNDKKKAKEFLVNIGVYNKQGALNENYKHLCTLQEQA